MPTCSACTRWPAPHTAPRCLKRDLLESLPRLNHFFLEHEIPYKLQPGSVNYEMTYSLTGLWDYVEAVSRASIGVRLGRQLLHASAPSRRDRLAAFFAAVAAHEETLAEILLRRLRDRPDVEFVGLPTPARSTRVPTISFHVPGRPSEEIVRAVDAEKIGIRFGDFYARRLTDRLGITESGGVVRVSAVHYNTEEEVARAADAIVRALG
ncbi:MAG: aminotransferase class V-fold PLP-dependent enzyme [Candidatus Eisenbacteria bacterium]